MSCSSEASIPARVYPRAQLSGSYGVRDESRKWAGQRGDGNLVLDHSARHEIGAAVVVDGDGLRRHERRALERNIAGVGRFVPSMAGSDLLFRGRAASARRRIGVGFFF